MNDHQINLRIAEFIDADPHWKAAKDYCNDLNAMHEAEKKLTFTQKRDAVEIMSEITFYKRWGYIYATARQRAEAFLRAVGKWEEAK